MWFCGYCFQTWAWTVRGLWLQGWTCFPCVLLLSALRHLRCWTWPKAHRRMNYRRCHRCPRSWHRGLRACTSRSMGPESWMPSGRAVLHRRWQGCMSLTCPSFRWFLRWTAPQDESCPALRWPVRDGSQGFPPLPAGHRTSWQASHWKCSSMAVPMWYGCRSLEPYRHWP